MTPDFAAVRAEFALPASFPPAVLAEAAAAAAARPGANAGPDRVDATDVPLVTIDPPGSKDLDQAVGVVARGDGFRVHYAIADLGAVVAPGGALDAEVRRRGQTVYLPDGAVPLHPPVLSEDVASLLPDGPRAAVLWRIDLDGAGQPVAVDVRRAVVASRARLDYGGVQADVDAGRIHPAIAALPVLGPLRRALAVARGAIELELPEQEVVPAPHAGGMTGGWTVVVRRRTAVEDWNAEISLLTGMSAAAMMLDAGIGLLRTLPAAEPDAVADLRVVARGLGVAWPATTTAAALLAGLPDDTPAALALRRAASALLRGAGYHALDTARGAQFDTARGAQFDTARGAQFDTAAKGTGASPRPAGEEPTPPGNRPSDAARGAAPPADPGHAGIGAPYAHVTAPLRRLVDRFGSEVCLALAAGAEVPEWLRAALPTLPAVMAASDHVAAAVSRACVDRTEAALLAGRVGEEFDAVVLRGARPDSDRSGHDAGAPHSARAGRPAPDHSAPGEVYVHEPPVLARCTGALRPGETARVRLVEADPTTGRITFAASAQS